MAEKKAAKKTQSGGMLRLKWVRSAIASPEKHKLVIKGLGFTRLNQVIEREDSPYYPSARLFRQPARGDWEPVFQRLEQGLREEGSRRWPG